MTYDTPAASPLDPAALDAADPLADLRQRFVGAESDLVYFDGNSLGRPLRATADRAREFVESEWGGRLIRGWEERWYDQPLVLGDEIGRVCLGAAPGQTFVGDSTTVLLYKLIRAAVDAAPAGRDEIVIDTDNFPTDRYLVEGIAAERGMTVRWLEVDPASGVSLSATQRAVGEKTALVVLSHVAYRSGHLAPAREISESVRDSGAMVLWDLCHSAGSVPMELDEWGVDLAVGCTYKYLNGGPGSPAFAYVAERHHGLRQPIQGWKGHADPFLMGPGYTPAQGVRRFISGTPPITAMLGLQDMVALIDEVGMEAVRAKSVQLTSYAVDLADELLSGLGVTLASPRDPEQRGGHVTLRHDRMRDVVARLWERDVIPDYRDPGGLRIGLSPLSTSFEEVRRGVEAIAEVLGSMA
ncbi:MAG: aminotransferase class V-fold PLP-dependent enzyme [Nocardioides sp.]|nr:aminotransferase class V-fold PLP-dependent enzyme [Nocardioides sp.]